MIDLAALSPRAGEILARWRRVKGSRWDPPLTPRQRELLLDVCQGLTYREIAELRGISPGTVKSTIHQAHIRLGIVGDRQTARSLVCFVIGASDGPITEPSSVRSLRP